MHRNARAPGFFTSDMLITDSAVHEVDAVRWLLDREVVRITALAPGGMSRGPGGVLSPQLLLLQTDAGVLVDVEVNVCAGYGYDVRCEVVGEEGALALAPPGGRWTSRSTRPRPSPPGADRVRGRVSASAAGS